MARLSIIARDGTTFSFDAVRQYALGKTVNVTDHPLETGGTISDHAQKAPLTFGFKGTVSETPWRTVSSSGGRDRLARALEFLDSIAGDYCTVVSDTFGTMEWMCITRYPTQRGEVRQLVFDVQFKQITIAEAGTIAIPPEAPKEDTSASAGAPDEQDVGEQPTTDTSETEPEQDEADASTALELAQALGLED